MKVCRNERILLLAHQILSSSPKAFAIAAKNNSKMLKIGDFFQTRG